MDAINDESSPPEINNPNGTSVANYAFTAFSN